MKRGPANARAHASQHNKKNMEILQINIDRKRISHDLLHSIVNRDKIDLCIISEPNKKIAKSLKYLTDRRCDAAIVVADRDIILRGYGGGDGFVWAELEDIILYSCYVSPNVAMEEFEKFLLDLDNEMKQHQKPKENKRGDVLAEWLQERDMIILNRGNKPTFIRGEQASFIDITTCSESLTPYVTEWRVTDEETLGCHQMVRYKISETLRKAEKNSIKTAGGWRYAEERAEKFALNMAKCIEQQYEGGGDLDLEGLTRAIMGACDLSFAKRSVGVRGKRAVYWWSAEIAQTRRECIKRKRTLTRTNRKKESTQEDREHAQVEYKRARAELKKKILESKKEAWKNLIQQLDDDIWGKGYKIVTRKFGLTKRSAMSLEDHVKQAKKLFPTVPEVRWGEMRREEDQAEPTPMITASELQEATKKIKTGKAPGPDQIPPEVIKLVAKRHGTAITSIYNDIICSGIYPDSLKKARLVLVEKPKKEGISTEVTGYRPICLLDVLGKVLETILVARLTRELEDRAPLSKRQYGFRKGKSSIDAMQYVTETVRSVTERASQHKGFCALITLDVENAFNTARWNYIIEELEKRKISGYLVKIIKSYLTNRTVVIGETTQIKTTCGVPQGSVLGQLLWNVQYDGVFGVDVPQGVGLVGYADDLAVLVTGKRREEIQMKADIALAEVIKWIESKGLRVAPHKTEVVVLAGRRKVKEIQVRVKENIIKSKGAIKYLGVTFGKDLHFAQHIKTTADKANEIATRLARAMPSIGGPRASRRKMLYTTVKSVMMYAAPVWGGIMSKAVHRKRYEKVYRRMLLGVTAAYRTVSTAAVEVIAGVAPIDLQVEESVYIHKKEKRKSAKNITLRKWQKRWDEQNEVAQWTKRLIPNIKAWVTRKHGETNHHITQVLSGHGCFGRYLHRFKILETDLCVCCGPGRIRLLTLYTNATNGAKREPMLKTK